MLFTTVLATLVASAAAAKDKRTFAVLHHYGNGPLTTCRADPIVSPGGPSSHVHTVMGASNFGFNTTGDSLKESRCTTAKPKADLSAYWFPTLYFQDPSTGLLEPVKFYYMNVYYFFEPTNDDIKAFPLGLQMVSGNAMMRTAPSSTTGAAQLDPSKGPIQPVQITCPRGNFDPPSWPADSDGSMAGIQDPNNKGSGIGFPFQDCDGYASPMRIDIHFPSCYNPAAGLTDYKNNMQFPKDAGGGKQDCPEGWIHVPHIFFETYWQTHDLLPRYKDLIGKASPFVFSNGDTTGFSAHGDFISGWDEEELQHIIDTCDAGHAGMESCPGLKLGVNDGSESCNIECPVDEKVDGKLEKLPGNNPLAGWGKGGGDVVAPAPSSIAAPTLTVAPSSSAASSSQAPAAQSAKASSSPAAAPAPQSTTLIKVPVSSAKPSAAVDSAPTSQVVTQPQTTVQAHTTTKNGKVITIYDTVTVWQTKTVYANGAAPTQGAQEAGSSSSSSKFADISGFKYVGCYKDASTRVLSGEVLPKLGAVSNTACVNYCASKGFSVAGTEYGGECYCGNGLSTAEELDEAKCHMACKGDEDEVCGGDWALTLYTKSGEAPSVSKRQAAGHQHGHYLHHARVPSRRYHHHHRR